MGDRTTPNTPYRKGLQAGQDFFEAHQQWLQEGGHRSGQPKPERPVCPYRKDQLQARRGWQQGIDYAVRSAEQRKRCGGKPPQWRFS